MARPTTLEIIALSVAARHGDDPAQAMLVAALTEYLVLTGVYVRAGISGATMVYAFDQGVTALMYAAGRAAD